MKKSRYNIIKNINNEVYSYNSITKSFIKGNIEKIEVENLTDNQKNELKKHGFLTDNNNLQNKYLEYLFNNVYFSKHLLNIVLVPLLRCNFSCPYCFEDVNNSLIKKELKLEEYFKVLYNYSIKNFEEYNVIELSLFGGEPLLYIDKYVEYYKNIKKRFEKKVVFTTIVTNGSLLIEENVRKLIDCNCKSIQISIDSCKEQHNITRAFKDGRESYDLIINNANSLLKYIPDDINFNLRINLNNTCPTKVRETLEDIECSLRSKVNVIFRPIYKTEKYVINNVNKLDELKVYLDMAQELGFKIIKNNYLYQSCEACSGDRFWYLMPDLSVWKCINELNTNEAYIGNIKPTGDIEYFPEKIVNWYAASNCFSDTCNDCNLLPDCFGGCVLYKLKNNERKCKKFEMTSLPYLYESRNHK